MWNAFKFPPQFLFHYTGNEGLRGIVETTSFWATDARFLNDSSEVQMAVDAAREVVTNVGTTSAKSNTEVFCEEILKTLHLNQKKLYIFSVTANGDSLNHWRSYCPENSGYAIGFKADNLKEWCEDRNLRLSNVIYGTDLYRAELDKLLAAYIDDLDSYFPYFREGEINSHLLKASANRFTRRALSYAPFIKHKAFTGETEWRIVHFPDHDDGNLEISFREGSFSLIPYALLKFEPSEFFPALGIINLKPSDHSNLQSEGMREFIRLEAQRHGLGETMSFLSEVSSIPFRPGF